MSADDVRAMLDAGADLVQLYTGYIYEGPGLVRDVCRALIADAERVAEELAAMRAAEESMKNEEIPETSGPEPAETAGEASNGKPEEKRHPGSEAK